MEGTLGHAKVIVATVFPIDIEKNELLNTQATWAAVALAEATARAVQRIPDAKCNGDMHAALDYAAKVKHDQKEFLAKQGIHALYD